MSDVYRVRRHRRDTVGHVAIVALAGLIVGAILALAIIGLRDTIHDFLEGPLTCTSVTFA